MDEPMDFASVLNGLQQLSERDKIILFSLIDRQRNPQAGEGAKIERYIGQMIIDAAREKRRQGGQISKDDPGACHPEGMPELRSNRAQRAEVETSHFPQPAGESAEGTAAALASVADMDPPVHAPFKHRRASSLVTYLAGIWQPQNLDPSSSLLKNS